MRNWSLMLGGLIAWAAQFFALYILASIFGSGQIARAAALLVTLAAFAVDLWLIRRAGKSLRRPDGDDFNRWLASLTLLVAMVSLIAVLWQSLPALLS